MTALRSVVLAGGGTAGHVSPLLALADRLRQRDPDIAITVIGTESGLEARLVPERGYELKTIPKVPFPRKPSAALLRLPGALAGAIRETRSILNEAQADVVVGFGGYVATPAYLAARAGSIPIVVHEQNARPGLANRLGARLAESVAVTFPGTPLPGAVVTGMPLRDAIVDIDRDALRQQARSRFGLVDAPTVLVTGGSLGAARLNGAFRDAAPALSSAGIQVLHLTGSNKDFEPPAGLDTAYVVVDYLDRMDLAYAVADLTVARAGASTVAELTALGMPAIYVPLPIGNGEQRLNAAGVVDAGGGLSVPDDQVTPVWVDDVVRPLALDSDRLEVMGQAAASHGVTDGADRLADLVVAAGGSRA